MERTRLPSVPFSISISICEVNYVSAIIFTIGCLILVGNAVLTFLPFIQPTLRLPIWVFYIEGSLSMMSSALFVLGGLFCLIYVVNAKENEILTMKHVQASQSQISNGDIEKATNISENGLSPPSSPTETLSEDTKEKNDELSHPDNSTSDTFLWRVSLKSYEIWTYYILELGFMITTIFLCSSTVFFSASIAAIITIVKDGKVAQWIRYPQMVAAVGFLVASFLIMIQTQKNWWRPAWHNIRWYVGLVNFVGSAGFIVCSCFGLFENVYWARYQFGMSYLWGSWCFLIASALQWHKSLKKRAIEKAELSEQQ